MEHTTTRAAFPNNSTHQTGGWSPRAVTSRRAPFQGTPMPTPRLYISEDFKLELLPLHSPLLGQSRLVSGPPLIDMLKFSGYSYTRGGERPCVCVSSQGTSVLPAHPCMGAMCVQELDDPRRFTLRFACRGALHRCESQEIRC